MTVFTFHSSACCPVEASFNSMTRIKKNKEGKGKKKKQRHMPYSSDRVGIQHVTKNDIRRMLRRMGVVGQQSNCYPAILSVLEDTVSRGVRYQTTLMGLMKGRKTINRDIARQAFQRMGYTIYG
jgi:hypothetical protein